MTAFILSLITFFVISGAHAEPNKESVQASLFCQQDDGDQWIEVGIAENEGFGLRAYIILHDEDTLTDTLIASLLVSKNKKNSDLIFENQTQKFRLVVFKSEETMIGNLIFKEGTPKEIRKYNLPCYENGSVFFEI